MRAARLRRRQLPVQSRVIRTLRLRIPPSSFTFADHHRNSLPSPHLRYHRPTMYSKRQSSRLIHIPRSFDEPGRYAEMLHKAVGTILGLGGGGQMPPCPPPPVPTAMLHVYALSAALNQSIQSYYPPLSLTDIIMTSALSKNCW